MSTTLCTHCGRELDPDAPGTTCSCRDSRRPPRRPSARSPLSNLGRVAITAAALSNDADSDLDEHQLDKAALIHRNPIEA